MVSAVLEHDANAGHAADDVRQRAGTSLFDFLAPEEISLTASATILETGERRAGTTSRPRGGDGRSARMLRRDEQQRSLAPLETRQHRHWRKAGGAERDPMTSF